MSNAGKKLDAYNKLYLLVKSVQPEWAAKITGMIVEKKTQKEIAEVTHEVLLDWIGQAMFDLRRSEFYVDWHEKYNELEKKFEDHMHEMEHEYLDVLVVGFPRKCLCEQRGWRVRAHQAQGREVRQRSGENLPRWGNASPGDVGEILSSAHLHGR